MHLRNLTDSHADTTLLWSQGSAYCSECSKTYRLLTQWEHGTTTGWPYKSGWKVNTETNRLICGTCADKHSRPKIEFSDIERRNYSKQRTCDDRIYIHCTTCSAALRVNTLSDEDAYQALMKYNWKLKHNTNGNVFCPNCVRVIKENSHDIS